MRTHLMFFVFLAIAGCAQSGGGGASDGPKSNIMVQFTNMNVRPAVAEVAAGGTVVWTNMATGMNGVVSFPLSACRDFKQRLPHHRY